MTNLGPRAPPAPALGADTHDFPSPTFAQTTAEFTLSDDDSPAPSPAPVISPRSAGIGSSDACELRDHQNPSSDGDEWTPDEEEDDDHDDDEHGWGRGAAAGRRASVSTTASFQLYTAEEENEVVKIFDRKLVLFVAFLYMLSFLDRSNIGNAKIAGMDDDLQTNPPRADWYEWALSSFYITYICFEWMSLLWKVFPAHVYVSMLVLSWGIISSLQSVATSYPMLIALRALLGIGEAGFTGVPFYLSFFFKRKELAFRTAVFISAAPLASSFASTLAWLIVKFADLTPVAPWRLLFLIEGFPSVIASAVAWNLIPDSPQTARYLTPRQQRVAALRLRSEKSPSVAKARSPHAAVTGIKLRDVGAALVDPVSWMTASMFFLANMAYSSFPVFLPTIIREMGHSSLSAQALSAPPYLLAFAIVLPTARASDAARSRSPFILVAALLSSAGYAFLSLSEPLNLPTLIRYLALFPACAGFFTVVTLTVTWSINNQPTESRQGGGFALLQLVGQCGPLLGTRLYPATDAPYYAPGMASCAVAMLGVATVSMLLRVYMRRWNARMNEQAPPPDVEEYDAAEEEEGLVGPGASWKSPHEPFRYML